MKIILSRKGFDSKYGGMSSPILPDGRMISLPIPSKGESIRYTDLKYKSNLTFYDLITELTTSKKTKKHYTCHLDPDLDKTVIPREKGWKPIFGQIGAAQTHLENKGIQSGDLFLFFGTFARTTLIDEGLKFISPKREQHVIFGYLQIGDILRVTKSTELQKWMRYHPHATNNERKTEPTNNTIYIARDSLSWDSKTAGAGIFPYTKDLVLTKPEYSKSRWGLPPFFKNVDISYHTQDSWCDRYFQSASIGQEFVIQSNSQVKKWAESLLSKHTTKQFIDRG